MAKKLVSSIVDTLLYVKIEKCGQASYRGFKTEYLVQELSEMERYFLSCSKCLGISRDAVLSEGETLCELCKKENLSSNPVHKVRNSVADLNIKCPLLMGCNWYGKLADGEKHLKKCGKFFVTCPLKCGVVTERCEMNNHLKIECLLRETQCELCDLVLIFKNLTKHLKICDARPVVFKCGRVLRRDLVKNHIDKDCVRTEIECPYAKYSCKIGKIPRKDLLAHKKEFYIEHQDMIERENCLVTDKLGKCVQKHNLLEEKCNELKIENAHLVRKHVTLECDYSKLKHELRFRKKFLGVTLNLDLKSNNVKSSEFSNGQYRFICIISLSLNEANISLNRLSTSTYSDRNILCITECVLCLQETATEVIPHYVIERICLRIEIRRNIPIMELDKNIVSRYRQPDGIVKMEIYFDYDYITYKGVSNNTFNR